MARIGSERRSDSDCMRVRRSGIAGSASKRITATTSKRSGPCGKTLRRGGVVGDGGRGDGLKTIAFLQIDDHQEQRHW